MRNLKEKDIPRYTYLVELDLLICGVDHRADAYKQKAELRRFLAELEGCEHLFLEGTAEIDRRKLKDTYEAVAVKNYKGDTYFLEQGVDFFEIQKRFGISEHLFGMYDLLQCAPIYFGSSKNDDEFYTFVKAHLELPANPLFTKEYKEKTFSMFQEAYVNLQKEFDEFLLDLSNILSTYFREIRDYEIICPRTKDFSSLLEGKKMEVVGKGHVEYLLSYLRGEIKEPPKNWSSYIDGLKPKDKDLIHRIEELTLR